MMPAHKSHKVTYIEPERHDELSAGEPGTEQANASRERKAGGPGIAPGATLVPAMGGRARKGRSKLTHDVPDALPVSELLRQRARFSRRKVCGELAKNQGAGTCGMIASLLVKLGVEDVALREAALAEGKRDEARRFGESARMHLMYAREVCSKDAESRAKVRGPVDMSMRILGIPGGQSK